MIGRPSYVFVSVLLPLLSGHIRNENCPVVSVLSFSQTVPGINCQEEDDGRPAKDKRHSSSGEHRLLWSLALSTHITGTQ